MPVGAHRLSVAGYEDALTVRMREPRRGSVYLLGEAGEVCPADWTRDGSCLVFRMENGGICFFVEEGRTARPLLIGAAAVVGAAALAALLLIRRRRKKK